MIYKKTCVLLLALFSVGAYAQCDDTNFAAWDTFREDVPGMVESTSPGIEGDCKAEFKVGNAASDKGLLRDASPTCESSFKQKMILNVDAFSNMGFAQRQKIHNAQCVTNAHPGSPDCGKVGVVQFRLQGNKVGASDFDPVLFPKLIRSYAADDGPLGGGVLNERYFDIPVSDSAGDMQIEYHWTRSTAPGVQDGTFKLWFDGNTDVNSPDVNFTDLDNHNYCIDRVTLGIIEQNDRVINNQAGNPIIFDSYESRRQTNIIVQ